MGTTNNWVEKNYEKIAQVCRKISNPTDWQELCQYSIEKFLINPKSNDIMDDEKLFYLTRIIKNNYHSSTSQYHKIYRKHKFEYIDDYDIMEPEYEQNPITIEWVVDEVEKIKREQDWYLGQLFLLYIDEGGNLTKLSKRTKISLSSLSRDIKKVKLMLKEIWQKKLK